MIHITRWALAVLIILIITLGVRLVLPPTIHLQQVSATYQSFEVTLHVPREVRVFQQAPLAIEIKNVADQNADLWLGGNPSHDFLVSAGSAKEIWRMTNEFAVQELLLKKTFTAGETLRLEGNWNQRTNRKLYSENSGLWVLPGAYQVRGFINVGDPSEQIEIGPLPLRITF